MMSLTLTLSWKAFLAIYFSFQFAFGTLTCLIHKQPGLSEMFDMPNRYFLKHNNSVKTWPRVGKEWLWPLILCGSLVPCLGVAAVLRVFVLINQWHFSSGDFWGGSFWAVGMQRNNNIPGLMSNWQQTRIQTYTAFPPLSELLLCYLCNNVPSLGFSPNIVHFINAVMCCYLMGLSTDFHFACSVCSVCF